MSGKTGGTALTYRLLLLRHAKAGWAAPGTQDFDRPLTESGRAAAAALGKRMQREGLVPEHVLCSPARRARETWQCVATGLTTQASDVQFHENLYSSDARGYLDLINEAPATQTLLLVGHNPMMEDLVFALAHDGDRYALRQAGAGFPTCGLAILQFKTSLVAAAPGIAQLDGFLQPERL